VTPEKCAKAAALLRELAELFQSEVPEPKKDYYVPPILNPLRPSGDPLCCNCSQQSRGQLTAGWLCPVHGRQF